MSNKLEETFRIILGDQSPRAPAEPPPPVEARPPEEQEVEIEREEGAAPPEARGGYFYPSYLSDYLMRNLSLGEQSIFHRFYRLARGFGRDSQRVTLKGLGEACGVSPTFAASIVASLEKKGLVRVVRRNPLTRSAVYRLQLPVEIRERLLLCAVCHGLIEEGQAWQSYPFARAKDGTCSRVPCHNDCARGGPLG